MEPTITLHHYDTPLAIEEKYGGFAAPDGTELVEDFVAFAKVCFERFGDRVKRWLTINEVNNDSLQASHTRINSVWTSELTMLRYSPISSLPIAWMVLSQAALVPSSSSVFLLVLSLMYLTN